MSAGPINRRVARGKALALNSSQDQNPISPEEESTKVLSKTRTRAQSKLNTTEELPTPELAQEAVSKTRKRTQSNLNTTEATPDLSIEEGSKTRKRVQSKSNTTKAPPPNVSLEETDVVVGSKTARDRILALLDPHVNKKGTRSESKKKHKIAVEASPIIGQECAASSSAEPSNSNTEDQAIEFENVEISVMQNALRDVGLNTTRMEKEELIKNCNIYKDLIILPTNAQALNSLCAPKRVSFLAESDFDFLLENELTTETNPRILHEGRSTENQHDLSIESSAATHQKNDKGKGECVNEDSDPEVKVINTGNDDHSNDRPDQSAAKGSSATANISSREPMDEAMDSMDTGMGISVEKQASPLEMNNKAKAKDTTEQANLKTADYEELKRLLMRTDRKVDILTKELRSLTQVVTRIYNGPGRDTESRTRGGQTTSQIRFHIAVLLGQKSEDDSLPIPADSDERNQWSLDDDLNVIGTDLPSDILNKTDNHEGSDPQFPYPNGPGHRDATTEQLAVIWHMMNAVGVSSFRPNLSESAGSYENKWLWKLALKIFIKLVEFGEYTGVPLDDENMEYIKKCFDTHVQTLMKRYQQENWDEQRRASSAAENNRGARLARLKQNREKIIISNQALWPLLTAVPVACSDDETDAEASAPDTPRRTGHPICARKLEWRNPLLGHIWQRIDARKDRVERSIPGASSSPGRGRPNRPRIRREDAPKSRIQAPEGLSIDCYSDSIAQDPGKVNQLGIQLNPILPQMLTELTRLGWL